VDGLFGNKAKLSPAGAGAWLSLAIHHQNVAICKILFEKAKKFFCNDISSIFLLKKRPIMVTYITLKIEISEKFWALKKGRMLLLREIEKFKSAVVSISNRYRL